MGKNPRRPLAWLDAHRGTVKLPGAAFTLVDSSASGFARRMDLPPPLPPKAKSNLPIIIAAGLLLVVIVACGLGMGGVMLSRRAQARREALAKVQKSVSDERTKMVDSIKSGKMGDAGAALGRVKDQFVQSASQLGGADGKAAQALAGWLATVQTQMHDYQASAARLQQERTSSLIFATARTSSRTGRSSANSSPATPAS